MLGFMIATAFFAELSSDQSRTKANFSESEYGPLTSERTYDFMASPKWLFLGRATAPLASALAPAQEEPPGPPAKLGNLEHTCESQAGQ